MRIPLPVRRSASRLAAIATRQAAVALLGALALASAAAAPVGTEAIGRAATPAEVKAWDIDVRADFKGLPAGSGTVAKGADLWDEKCASCHGAFGESNQVFTPIVGGTSKKDIEAGRVFYLSHPGYPHRTTLMRASHLSTLWDYINRAMPWNAPKSLATDEVYSLVAYILNLGEIVPADFTLSNKNIAEVEKRLPNRNGKIFFETMWNERGQGDVKNPACMKDCPVEGKIESSLPEAARNANGNIAEQVRPFGPARGTDTSQPPRTEKVGVGLPAAARPVAAAIVAPPSTPTLSATAVPGGGDLVHANGCTACHGLANKIVGPAFKDMAKKYAGRSDAIAYLAGKIRLGGQGVWGQIPMPPQAGVKDGDVRAIAQWLAEGAP